MEATLRFCISSLIAKAALIFFSYELGQGDKTSSRKRPHDFTFSWMTSGGEKKKGFDVVHVECCLDLRAKDIDGQLGGLACGRLKRKKAPFSVTLFCHPQSLRVCTVNELLEASISEDVLGVWCDSARLFFAPHLLRQIREKGDA
ncbi:uncharacterized [Tachysurus ichikawai]